MYDHPPMMHAASDPVCTGYDGYDYRGHGLTHYPQYPHGSYGMYGEPSTALVPMSRRLTGPGTYSFTREATRLKVRRAKATT